MSGALPVLPGYDVLSRLGEGGMATVYRARQRSLGRDVAIKCLRQDRFEPESRQRLAAEARILAGMGHPGIVAVHDVIESDAGLFLVMEHLAGGSLRERLAAGVTRGQALAWLVQVARALDHAHRRGVVHRDLKPENILFRDDDTAVLTDFGIAQRRDTPTSQRLTAVGAVLGTPAYLSPEQVEGEDATARSDLYALGALVHEMLTGTPPFVAETTRAVMLAHLHRVPPPLPAELAPLQVVRDRLLSKSPDDRPASAAEALNDLKRCLREHPTLLGSLTPQSDGGTSERMQALGLDSSDFDTTDRVSAETLALPAHRGRSRWGLGIAAAAVAAALLLGWVWQSPAPPADAVSANAADAPVTVVSPVSLAVLPLRNLSGEAGDQYFADGLTEEMIGLLSRIEGLRVPSRASSFAMAVRPHTPAEIGALLSVEHLVDGSVRRQGERARISLQLVRIGDDRVLWSEHFERDTADLLRVQDEIARAVATAPKVELGVAEPHTLLGVGTEVPEAYDAYLRGLQTFHLRGTSDLDEGRRWLQHAIELDPGFARAHGMLALLLVEQYALSFDYREPPRSRDGNLDATRAVAERALELDPRSAEAWLALGRLDSHQGRWASAIEQLSHGIELDPANATGHLWRAITYFSLGRRESGARDLRAALARDPASRQALDWTARMANIEGDIERALEYTDTVLRLGLGTTVIFHIRFFCYMERLDAEALERDLAQYADLIQPSVMNHYRAVAGRIRDLRERENPPADGGELIVAHFLQPPRSLETAAEAIRQEYRDIGVDAIGWMWYPALSELRQHPQFTEVMEQIGMIDYWRAHGWPDLCRAPVGGLLDCD
jgi:eukaryotic-like serine/threonine-protein kinase